MRFLGRATAALETLSTLLVIVAASALLWTIFFKQPRSASAAPPLVQDVTETIAGFHLTNVRGTGEIAIVEFTDFQCPFCARHAAETLPALEKELIDTGKARYFVVNLPLPMHPQAKPAAEAAECAAEQGKFWVMHDLLFERQQEVAKSDDASLVGYANELGLDAARFERCLREDVALARVKADQDLAVRVEARGTPTIFLGRMRADGGVDALKRVNGAAGLQTILDAIAKL
jgi:protein-disulfide isomerase